MRAHSYRCKTYRGSAVGFDESDDCTCGFRDQAYQAELSRPPKSPIALRPGDIAWQAFQHGIWSGLSKDLLLTEVGTNRAKEVFRKWWSEMRELGHGPCSSCGFDAEAIVTASWSMLIDRDPPSLNARLFNSGPRAFLYRKERDAWCWMFRAERLKQKIPVARRRRRATLVRRYEGRQQERDRDNLIGGMKAVVDAMVSEKLLIDDSPESAEIHYAQERGARGLVVKLEELG